LNIDELIEVLGLADHANKLPAQLSGGQQQRTSIGRAIVKNPDILLCDEPTGALDYQTSKEIMKLIERVNQTYHTTILMVTHSTDAASHANRVLFIRDGVIFHQLYRGDSTNEELYKKISGTLTMLRTGGDRG
jgi:putative ABC transport system ATP-binding protein